MSVLYKIYQDLGIAENIQFVIHSLGDDKSKEKYRLALMNYYTGKERNLCDDCRKSLEEESPFSLLTCAEEDCKILSDLAPLSDSYINKKSKDHYQKVKDFLDIMELPYVSEGVPSVSLENHNDIVFSVKYTSGDMSVLLGTGGRHDSLSQKMGSTKEIPAFGFS
ncbi:MAG: hypothetical protein U9Q15_02350 [Patescibacteria group bacterium]|nr:hypothetical protein [Patescibacteria group bacterium]